MRLLADIDPPPHGLAKLRARARRGRRHRAFWAGLVLGPAAAAAVVLVLLVRPQPPVPVRFDHPALTPTPVGVEVMVDGHRLRAIEVAGGAWLVP